MKKMIIEPRLLVPALPPGTVILPTPAPWEPGRCGCIVSREYPVMYSGADDIEYYGGYCLAESMTEKNVRMACAARNFMAGIPLEFLEEILYDKETLLSLVPAIRNAVLRWEIRHRQE